MKCTAVVAAAGSSLRNGGKDKLTAVLGGETVLCRTLRALDATPSVAELVLVCRADRVEELSALAARAVTKPFRTVVGGATRGESVLRGVEAASGELVAVHDGARPFVSPEEIEAVITAGAESGAAVLACPIRDTVKEAEDGRVVATRDRSRLWCAQTPQVFRRDLLLRGYRLCLDRGESPTDDCAAAEAAGASVVIVEGSPKNMKLTTPADFDMARGILARPALRVGHGYDVHRLTEGRPLILGGVDIPFEKGLLGHSDADVLTHAAADALLGALALGDIGKHFPDTDPAYAGADSLMLLSRVAELCREAGYRLSDLDVTVLCQRPKLAPHIPAMRENLARALGCDASLVSVKATTEEGLGFTGSGEGIAAHAVCMMEAL